MTAQKIYELLPAFYRLRDAEQGEPLKALVKVIARETGIMEDDITRLYNNWFIETCDEWVVPYIGDLLGVRGLHEINEASAFSRRAYVANTLSYRRRKGTAPVLEQLAFDTTGWRARAVEFFQLLGATQHFNHVRLENHRTPDLRRAAKLELIGTPFDSAAYSADVRHISSGRGKHNIPNIGLFLWRLQSYPMQRAWAPEAQGAPAGSYTFSPLGMELPLFNRPQAETEITHLAEEINVPGPLRRRPLHDELESRRNPFNELPSPFYQYFDDRENSTASPVFQVFLNGESEPVPPEELVICHLDPWHPTADKKTYSRPKPGDPGVTETEEYPVKAAVDPVNGRIAVSDPGAVSQVQVSYSYAFSGDVGGGPYNRRASIESVLQREENDKVIQRDVDWQVGVGKEASAVASETIFDNITAAVDAWNQVTQGPGKDDIHVGLITVMDNFTYPEQLTGAQKIEIPEGKLLIIAAAGWPVQDVTGGVPGQQERAKGRFSAEDLRPHLGGNLSVKGAASATSKNGGTLVIDGLLIEGKVTVVGGNLGQLTLSHSTLVPAKGGLLVNTQNEQLTLCLDRCICGPIDITPGLAGLIINESIVDNAANPPDDGPAAIHSPETPVQLEAVTILGSLDARGINASNSIFTGMVDIQRRQTGCIRFSYLSLDSVTPRRFRCQPELEIDTCIEEEQKKQDMPLSEDDKNAISDRVTDRLAPSFTARTYGAPAYSQLSRACHTAITTGADDGSEMGVFGILKQPQREANLRGALEEYLRFGMEAGIFYVT
jgi:hypothetical protein